MLDNTPDNTDPCENHFFKCSDFMAKHVIRYTSTQKLFCEINTLFQNNINPPKIAFYQKKRCSAENVRSSSTIWVNLWPNIPRKKKRRNITDSNRTFFFRFVDKWAIYRWYNLIRTCAGECDWLFHWQHKLCATFSANVNIILNDRLPI